MKHTLTPTEITKTINLCFSDPAKACAIAQEIINACGIVSCSTYAKLSKKSKRHVNYNASNLIGISIENRRFISINQK